MNDIKIFYALVGLSEPCLWDLVTGSRVSHTLYRSETEELLGKFSPDEILQLVDAAEMHFSGVEKLPFKKSRWSQKSPILQKDVSLTLSRWRDRYAVGNVIH